MRDLFLLAILPVFLYAMAQRPFIAVGMWVWTALFFPNGWVYGMAGNIRYNLLFTAVAIVGYLALRHKPKVHFGPLGVLVMLFFAWTTISSMATVGLSDVAWEIWSRFAKIIVLFVFVLLVVEKKLHIDFVLWCVVFSVGFYADLEALKFVSSGGHHKIEGMAGHVLGDRNELAVAFVMTVPICYYLLGEYGARSRLVKLGLLGTMGLLVLAVIGTQSRGGFIALIALGMYLFVKSERKGMMGLVIAVIAMAAVFLASNEWVDRINTIESADEDQSFMARVVAWKMSFILASQNPIFGGGFKSMETLSVWRELCGQFFSYPWFYTGDMLPNPAKARAAHSVYFQVMGDHGFVGLALYVSFLAGAFFKARKIARSARLAGNAPWLVSLATMLQLSIFAFSLGGAALSFAYFDLIFAIIGLVIVLDRRILPQVQATARVSHIPSEKGLVPA